MNVSFCSEATRHIASLHIGVAWRSEVDVFSGVCLFVYSYDNIQMIKPMMMILDS